jgi:hypothetical protein
MYNFIFIFFYKLSLKRNPDAKGAAKTFVALTTFMHLFLLVSIITFAFDIKISSLDESSALNKLYFLPILILWYFLISLFYNKKKINQLVKESESIKSIVNFKNILLVLLIIVVPTIIAIKLTMYSQAIG